MAAETRLRDTRCVFSKYHTRNSVYSQSEFCAQSAVCILFPVCSLHFLLIVWRGICDKKYRFNFLSRHYFMLCLFLYQSNSALKTTYWSHNLGPQPVETPFYNRNASSNFPYCFLFFPLSTILNSQAR